MPAQGKTTLARQASLQYDRVVIVTNYPDEFSIYPCSENIRDVLSHDKICFSSEEMISNEIVFRWAYEAGNRLLVVDEAHLYIDSQQLLVGLRNARKHNLEIILISHSFYDFERIVRSLIQNVIVFRIEERFELSRIKRYSDVPCEEFSVGEFSIIQGGFPLWLNEKNLKKTRYGFTHNMKGKENA